MEQHEILEYLLKSADWRASRSSGSGGQHRDKASTRAELTLAVDSLTGLPSHVADQLATGLRLNERPLRIVVQDERSLTRNQEIATERLRDLVARALEPPVQRVKTRPSRSARERRLADKARDARDKLLRQPPVDSDYRP